MYYSGRDNPPHPEIWINYFLRMVQLYSSKVCELQISSNEEEIEGSLSFLKGKEKELLFRQTANQLYFGENIKLCNDFYTSKGDFPSAQRLENKGVLPKLNYNAIAQGYSCDVVAAYLYSIGVKDMMVDIGEIYCDGVNPSGSRWTICATSPAFRTGSIWRMQAISARLPRPSLHGQPATGK